MAEKEKPPLRVGRSEWEEMQRMMREGDVSDVETRAAVGKLLAAIKARPENANANEYEYLILHDA